MSRAYRVPLHPEAFSKSPRGQKRPRIEDGNHLKWIRTLPCLVTGRRDGIEAAHIRYSDPVFAKREVGGGEKPDDRWTVPLHSTQHKDQHAHGDEKAWWAKIRIDPVQVAIALYFVTGNDEAAEGILREARERRLAKAER